jgi:hypothetical protein
VHGAWFWGAVVIAVVGVVALSASSSGSCPDAEAGVDDTCVSGWGVPGQWIIMIVTIVGVAYCLFRASRRNPGPPSER